MMSKALIDACICGGFWRLDALDKHQVAYEVRMNREELAVGINLQ